jgi:replicative DNA helicase
MSEEEYKKLEEKIDLLSDQLIEIKFRESALRKNYDKMAEFIKELRGSFDSKVSEELTKEQILENIKTHIEKFLDEDKVNLNLK